MTLHHQHMLLKLNYPNIDLPEVQQHLNDISYMNAFLTSLVTDVLEMEVCLPARGVLVTGPNNYGSTGNIGLVTSHVAYHYFTNDGFMTLDIYSCKCYDVEKVLRHISEYLFTSDIEVSYLDRVDSESYTHHYKFVR